MTLAVDLQATVIYTLHYRVRLSCPVFLTEGIFVCSLLVSNSEHNYLTTYTGSSRYEPRNAYFISVRQVTLPVGFRLLLLIN